MMRSAFFCLLFGWYLLSACHVSASEHPAVLRLGAEVERAQSSLAESQRRISDERKALLQEIAQAQEELRQLQTRNKSLHQQEKNASQQLQELKRSHQQDRVELGRLIRLFAGEGIVLGTGASHEDILSAWPRPRPPSANASRPCASPRFSVSSPGRCSTAAVGKLRSRSGIGATPSALPWVTSTPAAAFYGGSTMAFGRWPGQRCRRK